MKEAPRREEREARGRGQTRSEMEVDDGLQARSIPRETLFFFAKFYNIPPDILFCTESSLSLTE